MGNRLPGGCVGASRQLDRQYASVHQNVTHRRSRRERFGFGVLVNRSFFRSLLAFALSGRGLLGVIFHRALPCAMGFLPRWGVKKFAAT
ncbi:MAG: hypothetical protein LBQ66_15150 [Planctomycetaceae bacterium]|nr:hypothetical protein [Planctomycetaceae bacterium]